MPRSPRVSWNIKRLGSSDGEKRKKSADALYRLGEPKWQEVVHGDAGDWQRLGECGDPRAVEPLIRTLGDREGDVRRTVADALGQLGDKRAVEPLLKMLGDGDVFARCAAAEALSKLGDSSAVEPLIRALGDRTGAVRRAAAGALGKLGDTRAVEPLIKALGDGEGDVRRTAAMALGVLGDRRAVKPLIDLLRDPPEDLYNFHHEAAEALCRLADAREVEPLITVLLTYGALPCVIETLGELDAKHSTVRPLIDALDDEDAGVRQRAALMLGKLGDQRAVEPLIRALGDSDAYARSTAAEALDKLGDARAVEPLIKALSDSDDDVRRHAAEALGKFGDKRAVELLIKLLSDSSEDVRRAVAEALGKLGDKRAVEPLIEALGDEYWEVRRAAAEALGELGDKRAVEPLIEALGDAYVQSTAAEALDKLGDFPVKPLISAMWNGDDAAVRALESLNDRRAVDSLVDALGHGNVSVRVSAAKALAALGDPMWMKLVLGDDNDFHRLGSCDDVRAVGPLTRALEGGCWSIRLCAAKALVMFVSIYPSAVGRRWRSIQKLVKEPHADQMYSNDCPHGDKGIGLDFPDPPAGDF